MKKLLRKVFFRGECAKGAAFALTLLLAGSWLWCGVWHLLWLFCGWLSDLELLWGCLLIALYAVIQLTVSLVGLVKTLRRERTFRALWYLLPAAACIGAGFLGVFRFFPPIFIFAILGGISSKLSGLPISQPEFVSRGLSFVPPGLWAAVFALSLLLILTGCFFFVAMFAAAERKKLKHACGAAALTLWGVAVLWYFAFLGIAVWESRQTERLRLAVERRFGRSLDAAGLAAWYREQGKPDAAFWKRQIPLMMALPEVVSGERSHYFTSCELPDRPDRELVAVFDRFCREHHAAIAKWEREFDVPAPLQEFRFVPGELLSGDFPENGTRRCFVGMERNLLLLALQRKDIAAAMSCCRRIRNAALPVSRQPELISSVLWINTENKWLDCMEYILESRLPSDDQLAEFEADLAALEAEIPRNHRLAMYSELVIIMDTFSALESGFALQAEPPGESVFKSVSRLEESQIIGAFGPFRWVFPQCWYHAVLDKKHILHSFMAPDFNGFPDTRTSERLVVCCMLLPGDWAGYKFNALTARVRGMRALLRAERHRRRYGDFPARLDDLPLDPFTGKPLVYAVGPAKIAELVHAVGLGGFSVKPVGKTVDVVRVYSEYARAHAYFSKRQREQGVDTSQAKLRR